MLASSVAGCRGTAAVSKQIATPVPSFTARPTSTRTATSTPTAPPPSATSTATTTATPTATDASTPTGTSTLPPPTATATAPPFTATPTTVAGSLVQWQASADVDGVALLITPVTALRGSSQYALVLTTRVAGADGGSLQPSEAFHAFAGISAPTGSGPVALFGDDPQADGNPYPDPRLVRGDGTIAIPDHQAFRGMPDTAKTAAARQLLRDTADTVGLIPGFSTTAPIRIELSAPVDLSTVTPDNVLLFELGDETGDTWIERVLAAARARGVEPQQIALAFSFPTQATADDLRSIRRVLLDRAAAGQGRLVLQDPDPNDNLPVGVFHRGDPQFNALAAMAPRVLSETAVAAVVSVLLPSPDFRDGNGIFDPAKVSGSVPAPEVQIQVLMTLPVSSGPDTPIVIAQHGFGGSNVFALDSGARLAPYGLATAGISAVDHGRRGNPIDLLQAGTVQSRDIFRQTIADQMALVRALEATADLDGDGKADFDASSIRYLGYSLGGLLGAPFIAVEDDVRTSTLIAAGGRLAFLGQNPAVRAIYTGDLANRVGLTVDSPEFEVFLRRILELGQQAYDSVDPLDFARYWNAEPFSGRARRVLLQEGIGDQWVSNESTDELALAGGLIANKPMSDPAGVSGLWRFDPPGGHFIIDRDDVFAQAAQFLASDGTEIVDPNGGN